MKGIKSSSGGNVVMGGGCGGGAGRRAWGEGGPTLFLEKGRNFLESCQ